MGYLNCPGCGRRLRVPDSPTRVELRCPACRLAFRSDGASPDEQAPSPAADEQAGDEAPLLGAQSPAGRILSKADEAMLRDYGSGSGLLELTREAISLSAGGSPAPQAAPPAAPAAPDQSPAQLDRQFQVVGTALTLANKLVLAHKTELARSRRHAALGWSLLAAMTLAAAAAGWWAVRQSGLTELEQANVSLERLSAANLSARLLDANAQLADYKAREQRHAEELDAARLEHRATQAELAAARDAHSKALADLAAAKESLAEKKGAAEALTARLEAADARAAALAAEVRRIEAELAGVRAAQDSSSGAVPGPAPQTRPATMPASAPARPTPDAGKAHLVPDR